MPGEALYITTTRWYNANVQYGLEFLIACRDALGMEIAVAAPTGVPVLAKASEKNLSILECGKGFPDFGASLRAHLAQRPNALLIAGDSSAQNNLFLLRAGRKLIRIRIDDRPLNTGWINTALYRRLDGLALPSAPDPQRLTDLLGWPTQRLFVHPGSADRFEPCDQAAGEAFRAANNIPPDAFLLGLLGRLDPIKGHKAALDALACAIKKAPQLRLVIAGKEANLTRDEIRRWVKERKLENNVTLAGFLESPGPLIAASNAGLIASIGSEPQSRVLIEWALHRKPVLSARVGLCVEWGPRLGPTVEPGDATAMAEAMIQLAQSPQEMEAWRHKVEIAAQRFSRETWNQEIGEWLEEIIG